MPWLTVRLRPGVNAEVTLTQNEAGVSTSQLGRFKSGLFQKLGGWTKFFNSIVTGIPRALHAWEDLNENGRLAVGTTAQLAVITSGVLKDVSPQTLTTNPAPDFTTTTSSSTVTINDPDIDNPTTFDAITLTTPISVGGLILVGAYPINSILSATQYTIIASGNATSSVSNGGAVPSFTTISGSSSVTVTLDDHNLSAGQSIVLPVSTTVGGIAILGSYQIISVPDANTFTINASDQATSDDTGSMNAGNAQIVYSITLGPLSVGTAYGFGLYGSGPYGGTGSAGTAQTGSAISATNWTLDNWGEVLIGCPMGGAIYYWEPTGAFTNATPIIGGPQFNAGVFVSAKFQFVIAFGSTPIPNGIGFSQDPLFVKWCDQGNFLNWTVSSATQAGGQRLSSGSKIIAGYGGPSTDLLWTDLDLWAMDYVNYPNVFGFNKIADNCGIVGPHAFAALSSTVFWMGQSNFFVLGSGGASVLPCTVWDVVFQDLDTANMAKSVAWSNTPFNEVWFFYPSISGGIGECDKYVKLNTVEQTWDFGQLQRSAAIDQSVLGNPIAATRTGTIYSHESSPNADGSALNSFMQTGYFQIGEGEEFVFVDRIYPDMRWGTFAGNPTASILLTLNVVDYPGDTPTSYGPFTVTQATEFVPVRLRGRQMSMRVESNDLNSFWRIGGIRYRFGSSGRR